MIEARAETYYQQAITISKSSLPVTHPLYLTLVCNYSAFVYEIKEDYRTALAKAKEAF